MHTLRKSKIALCIISVTWKPFSEGPTRQTGLIIGTTSYGPGGSEFLYYVISFSIKASLKMLLLCHTLRTNRRSCVQILILVLMSRYICQLMAKKCLILSQKNFMEHWSLVGVVWKAFHGGRLQNSGHFSNLLTLTTEVPSHLFFEAVTTDQLSGT